MTLVDGQVNNSGLFDIPDDLITPKQDNIYTTSARQFAAFHKRYLQFPLPNDILFPWLHGVDGYSNQQNLFFGVRRSLVPKYRGLMVIHCEDSETTSRLMETVLPHQVLFMEPPHQYEFINSYKKDVSINLRNFQNQISRFSTICDLVLYGTHAQHLATELAAAQRKLHQERLAQIEAVQKSAGKRAVVNANTLIYKTIVIEDEFSVFERDYPELVMYDSTGLLMHRRDFVELENLHMRKMSKATEVTRNIWVGNTQDAPVSTHDIGMSSISSCSSEFSHEEDVNPHQFSICIEAHDLADMPLPSTLTLARETLNDLKDGQMPPEMIHFDVYATGVPNEKSEFDAFYARLHQLLLFMEDQAAHDRRILIHCSDGYTESSLLALTWIMYHCKLQLPEAYLYLQRIRSFFVYAADVPTLRRIEHMLFEDHDSIEPQPKRKKSTTADASEAIKRLSVGGVTLNANADSEEDGDDDDNVGQVEGQQMKTHAFVSSPIRADHRQLLDDAYINTISNTDVDEKIPDNIYRQSQLSPSKEEERLFPWFYSPRFEGSFPSRILPFLYLGNLNHATNPAMLKALNITHIVSVGEKADLDSSAFELLFLDNLYDDGIDSIQSRLSNVLDFVEDARLKGSTCLIHCRVGVSRSAAITICYVMKHLKFSLVQAYLFVRARRLNVIIQPNLKFMYEMLQLEQKNKGELSITWPVLCGEIHNLNSAYRDTSTLP
ncbi:DNA-binding protein snt1 [Mucor velutinosus]|uniref:DNA-binding protein snt1 n=1 Tax=Mucor velutinosus TaxID=708070 RepID=A0AAN7D735_9FUNG|nr:DNA-binding protein snt1 [Mucor velutinosus]